MNTRTCAFLFFFSALALTGCAEVGTVESISSSFSERDDFKRAETKDTSSLWSDFLHRYPSSAHKQRALDGFNSSLWHETQATNTAGAYISFVQSNPDNPNKEAAVSACKQLLLQAQGNEQDYADYLSMRDKDPDAAALRKALSEVRYQSVRSAGDLAGYELFVSQYPGSPQAEKLLPDLHKAAYTEAAQTDTRLAYQFFLKKYPSAAQAADAKAGLEKFPSPASQIGNAAELDKLLKVLRKASPYLVRCECYSTLAFEMRKQENIYTSDAEDIRDSFKQLASGEQPDACKDQKLAVIQSKRQLVANALQALAKMMERQQYLTSLIADTASIAANAHTIAQKASDMADNSEGAELEVEALYGISPADPQHPDETASKNAKEAVIRANYAEKLATHGSASEQGTQVSSVMALATRQTNLLMDIIATYEKPVDQPAAEN